jgi:hypothetical protein
MRLPRVLALLVLASASGAPLAAQSPVPGPGSKRSPLGPGSLDEVATLDLPGPNLEAISKEDAQRRDQGLPPRFAVPTEWHITPGNAGTWETLGNRLLWRLRIRALGARSLNLGFGSYRMPRSGSLHVYSADLVHVVRPFTRADNEAHGELWTPVVASDDIVVEMSISADELDELLLELSWINVGYRGFVTNSSAVVLSGSCNLDVVCPEGIPWELEIPSVGVISTGGSTFCTGFLVNNVRQDLKPYFMTAAHCGIGAGNAASLVVYWNFENSTCRAPGSPASGGPGDGSLSQFNTGSFFRSSYSPSDFTLVELDDAVDPAFGVSYAGWDATGANGTSAVAIHHPNTDEKRISFENQPTVTTSYLGTTSPGDGTHVRVVDWDLGTTEPGSSGSPVFDQAHRVLGQLHGGGAACGNNDSDYYGRFSVSWTGGGTSATRLGSWLDPDNTGALVIDTVSLDTLCSEEGTIAIERNRYSCSGELEVEVVDCDLDLDGAVAETLAVTVFSDTEPGGESLLLTESGPGTAHFAGSISLGVTDAPGVLQVSAGDTLSAEYVDADDGAGGFGVLVTDTALVDCTPPGVVTVVFSNVTGTSARVSVTTDEPALVEALYGFNCGGAADSVGGQSLATTTDIDLTGLQPDTTYSVEIVATDEAGNEARDDNGGACFEFTTLDVPNAFTEEFLGDRDLHFTTLVFTPKAGPNGYEVCRTAATGFPTDPAGGTNIPLADDGSALVVLTGGRRVKLYGTPYSSLFVNANGNLTFGSSDGTYTESLSAHFSKPRVAAHFDDLNPAAGGTISRKQLSNRFVVTWSNVPEYTTSNQNSFQIELFFDGTVRITYLALAADDGIAGLSRGTGTPPAFVEINLSGVAPCRGPEAVVGPP